MIAKIILIALVLAGFLNAVINHGETKKESKHSAGISFVTFCIIMALYYYAGVFEEIL